MYIKEIKIENIRSIEKLEMSFDKCPGWHIVIGDNGSGKSSFIKSVALNLVGPDELLGLRQDWKDWMRKNSKQAEINLTVQGNPDFDRKTNKGKSPKDDFLITSIIQFKQNNEKINVTNNRDSKTDGKYTPSNYHWGRSDGWFSVAYGPFRRFTGGDKDMDKLFVNSSYSKLAAHLTAFGENIALSESIEWFKMLRYKQLENDPEGNVIDKIKDFINNSQFLPHKTILETISSDGVFFKDGSGSVITVTELSDGYRSILSMTFEIIRQLIRVYGSEKVFKNIENGTIDLPGIVLIDEIDAHLHPTWQKSIGIWFTKFFPKLQFIVTTHSPLVCRAVENGGSIWRLPAPGTNQNLYKVTDTELNVLIFGNILDAYSTEMFGKDVLRSDSANIKMQRLAKLNMKKIKNLISVDEESELHQLRLIFPSNSNILDNATNS